MFEIDMSKEPESKLLLGINLWTVAGSKLEKTQNGDPKLRVKYRCGEIEMFDGLTLTEKAWFYTKPKLTALGVPLTFKGGPDMLPAEIAGKRVWIATIEREYETVDKSPGSGGRMVKRKTMQVDGNQLDSQGYQHESRVPPGATAPVAAGLGADDDTVPF
jgi:hypothetical protein